MRRDSAGRQQRQQQECLGLEPGNDDNQVLLTLAAYIAQQNPQALSSLPQMQMLAAAGVARAANLGLRDTGDFRDNDEELDSGRNPPRSFDRNYHPPMLPDRAKWLPRAEWDSGPTKPVSPDCGGLGKLSRELMDPSPPSLAPGTLVCLYAKQELVGVKQKGKFWELCRMGEHGSKYTQLGTKTQYPFEALFIVRRSGDFFGFCSLGAEGKMLQAVQAEGPHRATNYNFGDWEKWKLSGGEFVNKKWERVLGCSAHELLPVPAEEMKRFEQEQLVRIVTLQQQLKNSEAKLDEAGVALKDVREELRGSRCEKKLLEDKVHEMRSRLEALDYSEQERRVESARTSVTLANAKTALKSLKEEKECVDKANRQNESKVSSLSRELQRTHENHRAEMKRLEENHKTELGAQSQEWEMKFGHLEKLHRHNSHKHKEDVEKATNKKIKKMKEEHDAALKEKNSEIAACLEEIHRMKCLSRALVSQMEQYELLKEKVEAAAAQRLHAWDERGASASAYVPGQQRGYVLERQPSGSLVESTRTHSTTPESHPYDGHRGAAGGLQSTFSTRHSGPYMAGPFECHSQRYPSSPSLPENIDRRTIAEHQGEVPVSGTCAGASGDHCDFVGAPDRRTEEFQRANGFLERVCENKDGANGSASAEDEESVEGLENAQKPAEGDVTSATKEKKAAISTECKKGALPEVSQLK